MAIQEINKALIIWRDIHGKPIACQEKCKVLNELAKDLISTYRDAMDDALLLGCSEDGFRSAMRPLFASTKPTVKERS